MGIKHTVGKFINNVIDASIKYNYKSTPFIPNGRILPLDLKRAGISPEVIFDAGANIGQTANYFIKHFPQADIYCFEPVKATYDELIKNVKSDKIHPFNEGLGAEIKALTIHKNNSSGSSSLKGDDGRFFETELVQINTGQNFCELNKIEMIDILKMDVEGFEIDVLKGFGPLLGSKVKMIYSEVGFEKQDHYKTYICDLLETVSEHGFIVSGFYEPYRWGNGKLKVFYNVLLTNTRLIDI